MNVPNHLPCHSNSLLFEESDCSGHLICSVNRLFIRFLIFFSISVLKLNSSVGNGKHCSLISNFKKVSAVVSILAKSNVLRQPYEDDLLRLPLRCQICLVSGKQH